MFVEKTWDKSSFTGDWQRALPEARYSNLPVYGLRLNDKCLSRIAPPEPCLSFVDYYQVRITLQNGDLVIAEIRIGETTELTARRLRKAGNGWELHPEAWDVANFPIARFGGGEPESDGPFDAEVKVHGLVTATQWWL